MGLKNNPPVQGANKHFFNRRFFVPIHWLSVIRVSNLMALLG